MIGKPIAIIQVPNQRLFSVHAAAAYLNCDRKTLKKWTRLGELRAKDLFGRRAYALEDLDAFIDSRPPWLDNGTRRKSASALTEDTHV